MVKFIERNYTIIFVIIVFFITFTTPYINTMSENTNKEKGLTRRSTGVASTNKFNTLIQSLKDAEELADYVVNSNTFGVHFEKKVVDTNEDGTPKLDKDNKEIYKVVKNKSDVIAAIVLGSELGISPMAAITLGARLNAKAYTKVMRGRKLGLDPMTSIDLIHVIPTKNGDTVSTGVHVISGVLLKNGIKFEYLKDFEPVYDYVSIKTGKSIRYDESKHLAVDKNTTSEEINEAKKANKEFVQRRITNRVTTCVLKREGYKELTITYSIQDAIDAGLYRGINSDGQQVEGKDNWNKHPATMLRNRTLTIGGRIIGADYLDGMYSNEEAMEFTEYEVVNEEPIDIKADDHTANQDDQN